MSSIVILIEVASSKMFSISLDAKTQIAVGVSASSRVAKVAFTR